MRRPPRLAPLCLLAAALGCPTEEDPPAPPDEGEVAVSLLPEGGLNHVLPLDVEVTDEGVLYSTCNALPTVAEVDLADGTLSTVFDLDVEVFGHAFLHTRDDDSLWVTHSHHPPVMRLWPATGEVEHFETGLSGVLTGVTLPGGGLAVAGPLDDEDAIALQLLDADGGVVREEIVGEVVLGLSLALDGRLAALVRASSKEAPELVLFDAGTLEATETCPPDDPGAVPPGTAVLRTLSDGTYVATRESSIHLIRCGGEPWTHDAVEGGHRDALEIDGRVLVLSRRGTEEGPGLNWGMARWYDPGLTPTGDWFATGKNTGYGQVDPTSGWLWSNSEGTTEVWAHDPATGERERTVRLGQHIESVVADPDHPGRVFFTGRLTNTFGDVDLTTGEVRTVVDEVLWPVAPVRRGDALWLVAQMSTELVELDAETLEIRRVVDLEMAENTMLTFDDLAWHPDRDTLWLSHGEKNLLLEVDPGPGEVVQAWQLEGPSIDDWSRTGRQEVLVHGGEVLVVRNVDGWINRVDPVQDEPAGHAQIDMELMLEIRDQHRLDWVSSPRGDGPWYLGGFAFDAQTLAHRPDDDLDATFLIADLGGGHTLAWRRTDSTVVVLDADGATLAARSLSVHPNSVPDFAYLGGMEPPQLVYSELATAEFRMRSLEGLLGEAGL